MVFSPAVVVNGQTQNVSVRSLFRQSNARDSVIFFAYGVHGIADLALAVWKTGKIEEIKKVTKAVEMSVKCLMCLGT